MQTIQSDTVPSDFAADEKRRNREFVAHFNSIQAFLKKQVPDLERKERWDEFVRLVEWYRKNHKGWSNDCEVLRAFAALRNVITHQELEPDAHLFIPSSEALARIEQIRRRLEHPRKVSPEFERSVVTVQITDSMEGPLTITYANSFSQLPVYDGSRFRGLLTENGITRWLSHAVARGQTEVDLRRIVVGAMLSEEETRPNYVFVSREMQVGDLIQKFAENPGLEAALITETGSSDEGLLGIATQWDILEAMKRQ